jgi:predicted DNA-binding protein (UPF0251 family)
MKLFDRTDINLVAAFLPCFSFIRSTHAESMAVQNLGENQIIALRYLGGLTIEEAAKFLKLSHATLEREWTAAKAWLYRGRSPQET